MKTIEEVTGLLRQALADALGGREEVFLERPREAYGDLATNVALVVASREGRPPGEVAREIVANLRLPEGLVERVEVAEAGFINFTLSPQVLRECFVGALTQGEAFGRLSLGEGKRAQVEFVSANPTGPLTVGHGRQAALGDAVARILANAGYRVEREYYFNDTGQQVRMLGESIRAHYLTLLGVPTPVPERGYQGSYVLDIAQAFREAHGDLLPPPEVDAFAQFGKEWTFRHIRRTLERMGIVFDTYYSEASLYESGRIQATLEAMARRGITYEKDGATWLKGEPLGLDQDWVMVRSTGEPTYRLPDIAYHLHKLERGFDLIVDVFGADHQATYPVVLAAVKALGGDTSKVQVLIHQFVTVKRSGQDVRMSKRKGDFLTLDWLLDEVGPDAVRFFFLLRIRSSHLSFDVDLAQRQSEDNPVFYVQYAHARTSGILRYARSQGFSLEEPFRAGVLGEPEELALVREILQFPTVLTHVTHTLEPQKITTYLRSLATVFHQFYQRHRVIGEDRPLSLARLALVRATRTVLARGLDLLGVSAPERM